MFYATVMKRCADSATVDQELSAKVESELRIEKETRDSDTLPAEIQDFLDNSPFKVRATWSIWRYHTKI